MPTPLTDADKVLRNDTGKDIVEKLDDIAQALGVGVNADQINYNNTDSGLEATDVQEAIDEVNSNSSTAIEKIYNYIRFPYISNIDKVPYLFRKSGGSLSVGDWEEDKLVGGSVSFNQLIQNGDFPTGTESSWTTTGITISFNNGICNVTMSTNGSSNNIRQNVFSGREEHVIFATQTITSAKALGSRFFIGENYTPTVSVPANTRTVVSAIGKTKSSYSNSQLYFYFNSSSTLSQGDTLTIENAFAIDLTQMFGPEVAEYFYNLETNTAGAGVSAFKSLFQNDYYAYNTGEIVSVKTSAHEVASKNILPKFTGSTSAGVTFSVADNGVITASGQATGVSRIAQYIYLTAGTYTLSGAASGSVNGSGDLYITLVSSGSVIARDYDGSTANTFTLTQKEQLYIACRFSNGATSSSATKVFHPQIERGSTITTYEPYEELIYPLDSNLELRGSIKLDSTENTLYNDGDTYDSDGNVVRKCGYIEFDGSSDEDWSYSSGNKWATITISDMSSGSNQDGITNWLPKSTSYGTYGFCLGRTNNNFYAYQILDISGVTDLASWKTYLSTHPLQVRYPLATPTTETAAPFTNPQRVFNNGTEEYIDSRTIAMPVGHETKYQYNI